MTDLSVDARLLANERGAAPPTNTWVVILATAVLGAGAIALGDAYTWRQGALFLLGGALGLVLYHALFGFTSAWRVFVADGRGAGLRAQMLMLAVAVVLFFPALAQWHAVRPAGAWRIWRRRRLGAGRRIPVRARHAARRRLRLRHALYGGRRQFAHVRHARLLHHRLGARRLEPAVVVGDAEFRFDLADQGLGLGRPRSR